MLGSGLEFNLIPTGVGPVFLTQIRGEGYHRWMKITVVIPTYNEAGNLASMVEALFELGLEGLNILIVDDRSSDGTDLIADRLVSVSAGRVAVMHREGQRGLGISYIDGFRRALDEGADIVVQMDADFSHPPKDVPRLVKALDNKADVAIGSRYTQGGRTADDWGKGRAALSWSANAYARTILGVKVRDITAGFKAWKRSALLALNIDRVKSNGYVFQVEMAYLSELLGLEVVEVPICFSERKIGESKMSVKVKLQGATGVLDMRRRHHGLRVDRRK